MQLETDSHMSWAFCCCPAGLATIQRTRHRGNGDDVGYRCAVAYETPWIVFAIVNAPAALAGMAVSNLEGIQALGERFPVYLTAAILLWSSVGASIDRGVYRRQIRAR